MDYVLPFRQLFALIVNSMLLLVKLFLLQLDLFFYLLYLLLYLNVRVAFSLLQFPLCLPQAIQLRIHALLDLFIILYFLLDHPQRILHVLRLLVLCLHELIEVLVDQVGQEVVVLFDSLPHLLVHSIDGVTAQVLWLVGFKLFCDFLLVPSRGSLFSMVVIT